MAKQVQIRRGTTAENDAFTGLEGEVVLDTTTKTLRTHDGVQQGGYPLKRDHATASDIVLGRSSSGAGLLEQIVCTNVGRTIIAQTSYSDVLDLIGGAPIDHEHEEGGSGASLGDYAPMIHYHGGYAGANHNHLGDYAPFVHSHAQYLTTVDATGLFLPLDGSLEMTGNLQLGGNDITSTGTIKLKSDTRITQFGINGGGTETLRIFSGVTDEYLELQGNGGGCKVTAVGENLFLEAGKDLHIRPDGNDVYLGTDGESNKSIYVYSSGVGEYLRLFASSSAMRLDAVGSEPLQFNSDDHIELLAAENIFLNPGTNNVYIGEDGVANKTVTIYSDTAGDYLTLSVDGTNSTVRAVDNNLRLNADSNVYMNPAGGNVYIGEDGDAVNAALTIRGPDAGEFFKIQQLSAGSYIDAKGRLDIDLDDEVVFQANSATNTRIYGMPSRGIELLPATSNVYIGTDGGGNKSLRLYAQDAGDYFQILTGSAGTELSSVGQYLRLNPSGALYIRPSGAGSDLMTINATTATIDVPNVYIGTDGGADKTLTMYSGVAGDYLQIDTDSNLTKIASVGTGNTLQLESATNTIQLWDSTKATQSSLRIYGGDAGDNILITSGVSTSKIEATGSQLQIESTSHIRLISDADVFITPGGGDTFVTGSLQVTHSNGEVLRLNQDDTDKGFINFAGTSSASAANSLSTWTTGNSIQGFIRAEVNGTDAWIPHYDAPTS